MGDETRRRDRQDRRFDRDLQRPRRDRRDRRFDRNFRREQRRVAGDGGCGVVALAGVAAAMATTLRARGWL